MDDIKGPPKKAPVAGPPPSTLGDELETPTPDIPPVHEQVEVQPEEPKGGMKPWLVVVLVIVALAIGAGGVYLWQSSSSTSDETAALQTQLDEQAQKVSDYEKAAAEKTVDEKDKEIKVLTADNETLTGKVAGLEANNDALKAQLDEWGKLCGDVTAPGNCTVTP